MTVSSQCPLLGTTPFYAKSKDKSMEGREMLPYKPVTGT
jgi:hypothetical protein